MQLGMLLERLVQRDEQYVFVGNPLPFNGGWHFTAVNDFEHPKEQMQLSSSWRNIRIWHRVNYVATTTEDGAAAIKSREGDSVVVMNADCMFATIFLIGGLMPHTLNATMSEHATLLLRRHLEMGGKFAAIGHGLDVLIALGTRERSAIAGFKAAMFPNQSHLARISGLEEVPEKVCTHTSPEGATLISASYWGRDTVERFFEASNLQPVDEPMPRNGLHRVTKAEPVLQLDMAKLPGIEDASFKGVPSNPTVAVFVDNVVDPIEAYVTISYLMDAKFNFTMISHSVEKDETVSHRMVATETVFGNAMYGLKDCVCLLPTVPANLVAGTFDGFIVAGGQCPYFLLNDAAVMAIMDACPCAAAVCHGPEALIGTKWLDPARSLKGPFTAYYGCWMSFRHVLDKYEKIKPGEVCQDESGRLFSGNAPNSTKEMVERACKAFQEIKAAL
jgi:putative intracellular protease/amidase